MPLSNAIINIKNLRLRTYIGFNPEEREKRQDVVINMEIRYPAETACSTDDVDSALDYKAITKQVIDLVENGRYLLLEKLVADVLQLATEPEGVQYAKVSIDKPHALRFADSVSLTLEWQAD